MNYCQPFEVGAEAMQREEDQEKAPDPEAGTLVFPMGPSGILKGPLKGSFKGML